MKKTKQQLEKEIADLKAEMKKLKKEEKVDKRNIAIKSLSEYSSV